VDGLWQRRLAAVASEDAAAAEAALDAVLLCKERGGWPDFFAHGEAVAAESRAATAQGDAGRGLGLAQAARDLAPHRLAPHLALAAARWQQGHGWGAVLGLGAALSVALHEAPYRVVYLSTYGLWLLYALAVAVVGLAVAGLYRYGVPLWHDAGHLLPRRLTPWTQGALVLAAVLVPALLRLGPLSWALIWLTVLAPYMRRRERLASATGLFVLLLLLAGLPWLGRGLAYPGSEAEAAYLATRDLGADAQAARLAAKLHPTASDCLSLGLRARWEGNITDSRRWLQRALQDSPGSPEAYVALGNARWLQQAPNEAMAAYKKALDKQPHDVYALFNLSQAGLAMVTDPQDSARRLANKLDFRLVSRLAAHAKRTGELMAEPPTPLTLLRRPLHLTHEHAQAMHQVFRPLGGPLPRQVHMAVLLFLCGYMLWLSLPNTWSRRTTDCRRCGDAVCHRCVRGPSGRTHCAICAKIANPRAEADRQARIKKEIASHRFFARRLATQQRFAWALPGAGQLLKGEADWGLLVLTAFGMCVLALATAWGWVPEVAPLYGGLTGPSVLVHALAAVVVYGAALVHGLKEEQ
jgi:tetratricopeptide (TPR) repeat protein